MNDLASAPDADRRPVVRIRFTEFVALAAAMMATQALAIDAMLPAFPTIVAVLGVANPNHGQWIVTAYMVGLGCGQLFWGTISDRFGRRPVLLGGLVLYVSASLLCAMSGSFHALLGWRCIHGMAAASATVVRSTVRDLYSGRSMARVLSLTFMVFLTVPVLAPSIGQFILTNASWRFIFIVCGAFATLVAIWSFTRLPETLHPEYRLLLNAHQLAAAARLVLGNGISMGYTLATTVMFGALMAYVAMVQQIFTDVFHEPGRMPAMFALCAGCMGVAAFCNSRLVERLGMRLISHTALLVYIAVTGCHLAVALLGAERMWTFVVLQAATMGSFSLAVSNFGSMAMEPIGSVAGIGASLQGFISTGAGAIVGAVIGRQYHGSTSTVAGGAAACGLVALVLVLIAERGRLFRGHHPQTAELGFAH